MIDTWKANEGGDRSELHELAFGEPVERAVELIRYSSEPRELPCLRIGRYSSHDSLWPHPSLPAGTVRITGPLPWPVARHQPARRRNRPDGESPAFCHELSPAVNWRTS